MKLPTERHRAASARFDALISTLRPGELRADIGGTSFGELLVALAAEQRKVRESLRTGRLDPPGPGFFDDDPLRAWQDATVDLIAALETGGVPGEVEDPVAGSRAVVDVLEALVDDLEAGAARVTAALDR